MGRSVMWRSRRIFIRATYLAWGGAVGFIVVCAFAFGYAWGGKGLWTQEAAAWLQAVGSLLAVAIAILISKWQFEKERNARRTAEDNQTRSELKKNKQKVNAVLGMSRILCQSIVDGRESLKKEIPNLPCDRFAIPVFGVTRGREALFRVPLHEHPYTPIAEKVLALLIEADRYINFTDHLYAAENDDKVKEVFALLESGEREDLDRVHEYFLSANAETV